MKQNAPKDFKWGTMPLPSYKGKRQPNFAGNDIVLFKSASSDKQKGAWAFMKYLLSEKETSKWAQLTGYVPLRKSAVKSADFKKYLSANPTSHALRLILWALASNPPLSSASQNIVTIFLMRLMRC